MALWEQESVQQQAVGAVVVLSCQVKEKLFNTKFEIFIWTRSIFLIKGVHDFTVALCKSH